MTGLTTFAMSRTGQPCRAHKSAVAEFCRSLRRHSGQTRGFFHGLLPHQNQDQFLRGAQDENPFDVADATRAGNEGKHARHPTGPTGCGIPIRMLSPCQELCRCKFSKVSFMLLLIAQRIQYSG